jgi:hypothetical protein
MLQRIHGQLRRLSPRARLALAVLLTGAVAVLDLVSGSDLSLTLFYLIPIGGLAWYNGERAAQLLTIISAFCWLADGLVGTFHPGIAAWNTAIRTGFVLIVVLLITQLRQAYELQRTLAGHDSLTGLANFRTLSAALGHQLTPSGPGAGADRPCSLTSRHRLAIIAALPLSLFALLRCAEAADGRPARLPSGGSRPGSSG